MAESKVVLTPDAIERMREKFFADTKNIQAQNTVVKTDPFLACVSRQRLQQLNHVYEKKIELEGKPLTNQKDSGRCWIFACLNVMRIPFMKRYQLEEFEFSQTYLFFWDKIERCNFFLNNIIKATRKGEAVEDRLISFLVTDPTNDGGQWDMLVNLINRYGVIPKSSFPDTWTSEKSSRMNSILKSKLREFAKDLRDTIAKGATDDEVEKQVLDQMTIIYRIVGICLGIPSETITWEYYNKTKEYGKIGPISGLEFYKQYVKPLYDVDEKVCLVTDPRNPFGKLYELDYLGNVVGGRKVLYNNQPPEVLIKLVADSINENEAVWFGSDISKRTIWKAGLSDLEIHDFKALFGTDVYVGLEKADRLRYGDSMMIHAMVITAYSTDGNSKVTKFRVENTYAEETGEKGYFIVTADWFKEFAFEAVIDKKYVPADILAVYEQDPTLLPAWDPMGTLAQ